MKLLSRTSRVTIDKERNYIINYIKFINKMKIKCKPSKIGQH